MRRLGWEGAKGWVGVCAGFVDVRLFWVGLVVVMDKSSVCWCFVSLELRSCALRYIDA